MGALLLDRAQFLCACVCKKKRRKTTENNAYRIAVHLEDKRKGFQKLLQIGTIVEIGEKAVEKTKKHKIHLYTTKS